MRHSGMPGRTSFAYIKTYTAGKICGKAGRSGYPSKAPGPFRDLEAPPPSVIGSYDDPAWYTYDGYVMAVVRSDVTAGEIKVTFSADGMEDKTIVLLSD